MLLNHSILYLPVDDELETAYGEDGKTARIS